MQRGNAPVTPTRVRAPRQAAFLAERWRLGTWAQRIPRRPCTRRAPRGPNVPLPPLAPPRPSRCLLAPLPSCSHLCHEPGPFRPPPWRWHSAQGVAGVSGHPASTTRAARWSPRAVTLLGAGVGTLTLSFPGTHLGPSQGMKVAAKEFESGKGSIKLIKASPPHPPVPAACGGRGLWGNDQPDPARQSAELPARRGA